MVHDPYNSLPAAAKRGFNQNRAHALGNRMNDLPATADERFIDCTLDSSPNTYLRYPAFGRVVVHEFDVSGNPHVVGFQNYQTDGTFGPVVSLGLARDCEWRDGCRWGATVAVSFADREARR